ncbi:hypothetical protein CANARDRAFT_24458 [[Candida] arabinofermentans NRRL YB-2248]|uniref:Uncharacterized protein n=1 Tax=[Candida] arabinofermentans NRRL YB-2248 TaxID=983967 RepID=A0A1E4SX32_9ASCO|nr:hypothetical protein CANARDRAFT_24458 [[Candida] arabinofermentans NRRL YB-2248]
MTDFKVDLPVLYLRFPTTRPINSTKQTNYEHEWNVDELNQLNPVLKHIVKTPEGKFTISYDFTQLEKTLKLDRRCIFNKLIEMYYVSKVDNSGSLYTTNTQQDVIDSEVLQHDMDSIGGGETTIMSEFISNGRNPSQSNARSNSTIISKPEITTTAVGPEIRTGGIDRTVLAGSNATTISNNPSLKKSLLDKLELLKLGYGSGSASGTSGLIPGAGSYDSFGDEHALLRDDSLEPKVNSEVDKPQERSSPTKADPLVDPYTMTYLKGNYEEDEEDDRRSYDDDDDDDDDDESDSSEDDGAGSMIQLAAASMYLHRSKFLTKGPKTTKLTGDGLVSGVSGLRGRNDTTNNIGTQFHGNGFVGSTTTSVSEAVAGGASVGVKGKSVTSGLGDDYLLTNTTNSLSDSLLEQELLKRI